MKVTSEKLPDCQVALNIEVEPEELNKYLNEAYHRLANKVSVPGFRRGKVPRAILEQYIGRDALHQEALERLMPQLYQQAIESQAIEPIAEPQMELIQEEPMVFKATVSLKPVVELGDYHGIKLETELVEITEEEIAAAMEQIREEQGMWLPVDRPVQMGDLITLDIEATVDGKPFLNHKDMAYELRDDEGFPLPEFAPSLEGMEKNEEKAFTLPVPDDYRIEDFRGQECSFQIRVSEIKEKQLPEIDDELAKSAGYDDLSSMRQRISDDLKTKAEIEARSKLRQKALDALVEISQVDYPPIMEDWEMERILKDEAQRFGYRELKDYLEKLGGISEELKQKLRSMAKERITSSLVLGKFTQEEKIAIDATEVDNKVTEMIGAAEDKEKMEKVLALAPVRESVEQSLLQRKTIDRLVQIVTSGEEEKEAV